jgi:hypothetical protein
VQWHTPAVPATWEARAGEEHLSPRVRVQPGQCRETSSQKINNNSLWFTINPFLFQYKINGFCPKIPILN